MMNDQDFVRIQQEEVEEVRRVERIATTPRDAVDPADLAWFSHHHLNRLDSAGRQAVIDWLLGAD